MEARGPIPGSAIRAVADEIGINDPDQREWFFVLIGALDRVLLDHWAEQRKRDRAAHEARTKNR